MLLHMCLRVDILDVLTHIFFIVLIYTSQRVDTRDIRVSIRMCLYVDTGGTFMFICGYFHVYMLAHMCLCVDTFNVLMHIFFMCKYIYFMC